MIRKFRLKRSWKLIRREGAENYLLVVLLSFAASVSLTRFYLSVTGYPQLGGGELHIAHALWGGLLLFIAALLPLLLSNRRVFSSSAVIAGIGVGLFIDEVGKFITKNNNYFYPAAAPIVYTFFLLSILLFLRYMRPPHLDEHAELCRVLEDIQDLLRGPFIHKRRERLEKRLSYIASDLETGEIAKLTLSLLNFVQNDDRQAPQVKLTLWQIALNRMSKWLTARRFKALLIAGLAGLGLIAFKNPANILAAGWIGSPNIVKQILTITAGRHIEASAAAELANIRIILELIVGTLLLISVVLFLAGQNKMGVYLGIIGLFVSLTVTNLLVFYFEQFSTMIMVTFQFITLFGLIEYRRKFLMNSITQSKYHSSSAGTAAPLPGVGRGYCRRLPGRRWCAPA